ncbi:hypothetical protein IJ182_04105 [bacterium]|nr:hypothetical protein [bacterium]
MIKGVTESGERINTVMKKGMTAYENAKQQSRAISCADSFIKHSTETAPTLLAITTAWSVFEKSVHKVPFKQSFNKNFKGYFLPVLIATSAIGAFIENSKPKK